MDVLRRFHWPGNFRQLHNLLRTAVVMVGCDGQIEMDHLPDDFLEELEVGQTPHVPPAVLQAIARSNPGAAPASDPSTPELDDHRLQDVALTAMANMLRLHKGNVSAAAKALGVSRNTIYRKKDQLPPDVLN